MKPMSREFVAKLEKFVAQHQIPLVQFHKGQRKDDVMTYNTCASSRRKKGILFVGKAQERTPESAGKSIDAIVVTVHRG